MLITTCYIYISSSSSIMQPPSSSSSTIPYTRQHFIRDVLELAKQRLLSRHARNATAATSSSSYSVQGEMNANDNSNVDFMEMIVGICYILVVLLFLMKILLKMLGGFESHFMSSHVGAYNRFAFIANEDFEQKEEEEEEEELESNDDTESSSLSSSSPISLRSTLSITPVTHIPNIITPMNKINVVTPKTPSAPRRSLRLKIKSELDLTSMKTLNKTNAVTRSQTRESRSDSHFTNKKNSVSSDPLPSSSLPATSLFYRNQNNNFVATPSSFHPENDEELAYIVQRCYERTMKKRSRFNSPLLVRRLVL